MTTAPDIDIQTKLDLIAERVMGDEILRDYDLHGRFSTANSTASFHKGPWLPHINNDHGAMLEAQLTTIVSDIVMTHVNSKASAGIYCTEKIAPIVVYVPHNPDPIAARRLALVEAAYKLAVQMGESTSKPAKGKTDE